MAEITLRKYHGLGNDYLIYDPNRNACELQERQVEALCRRNLGVGADGILYGPFFDGDKMRVRIFQIFKRYGVCDRGELCAAHKSG